MSDFLGYTTSLVTLNDESYQHYLERKADAADLELPNRNEDYCAWSELRREHCAGVCCLDHYMDPDVLEAGKQ